ncbi:hypothetical protein GCM10025782_25640 [Pedococcus ginsenosidimutans]|uniref:Uncharacterized protein n=1 Tax=Pedococcus ginsenosidimutans TaxID=490570 RepID=A0ABP8YE48_9MICO
MAVASATCPAVRPSVLAAAERRAPSPDDGGVTRADAPDDARFAAGGRCEREVLCDMTSRT